MIKIKINTKKIHYISAFVRLKPATYYVIENIHFSKEATKMSL